jgi:hypothetical protein
MNNLKWFQSEEGQKWLASKEHKNFIEGGKRGIGVGMFLGIPIGIIICCLIIQFGLL